MLKVGVWSGSDGPLFYPDDELRNTAHLWNGKPVLVNHPFGDRGSPISANNPRIWEGQVLGQVFNTQFDGNRLKAEIWLNEDRARNIAPELLNLILQGENIDVSTGLFTTDESIPGVWNGERYKAVARGHVPDHLALLPGSKGACSYESGCGIRANELDATFPAYRQSWIDNQIKKGGFTVEEPLVMPKLEEDSEVTVKDNTTTNTTNTKKADTYDMDVQRLWRTLK
jgi:hypothetical protein